MVFVWIFYCNALGPSRHIIDDWKNEREQRSIRILSFTGFMWYFLVSVCVWGVIVWSLHFFWLSLSLMPSRTTFSRCETELYLTQLSIANARNVYKFNIALRRPEFDWKRSIENCLLCAHKTNRMSNLISDLARFSSLREYFSGKNWALFSKKAGPSQRKNIGPIYNRHREGILGN